MRRDKKGQAAMEFLMTYGWAILAAIIVVGVLWYLIGNPANLAGNKFTISSPLVTKGIRIEAAEVNINFLNGGASRINVTAITFSNTDCNSQTGLQVQVATGAEQAFTIVCGLSAGDRFNSDVTISYTEGSSTFVQTATGSVTGSVS